MTNEIIEFYREHLKPIIQKMLLKTNYQGQGKVDYEEFGRDFDELLDLAIIGMQSNSDEPKQVDLEGDGYSDGQLVYDYGKCPKCGWEFEDGDKDWEEPYCCHCGQKLHWFESEE